MDFFAPSSNNKNTKKIEDREIDVGYRARKVPLWLGRLGVEKWEIADKFLAATQKERIVCDLSYDEERRIYGEDWVRFLTNCKTTLGVESGASVFDFTGTFQKKTDAYLKIHPNAAYEEVEKLFFPGEDGKVYLNQISPRCFEAACLKTVMILYEGDYSGVLKPWRHYIPLKKDFSNISEVVSIIKDRKKLQEIADRAYEEIALNSKFTYKEFIKKVDEHISTEFEARKFNLSKVHYGVSQFIDALRPTAWQMVKNKYLGPVLDFAVFHTKKIFKSIATKVSSGRANQWKARLELWR